MRKLFLLSVFTAYMVMGCASGGFDSIKKTGQLQSGMTYEEVVQLLGSPKASEFNGDKRLATFWLHQAWRGNVPMDLVFSGDNRLESWGENKDKFDADQKTLAAFAEMFESANTSGQGGAAPGPNDPNLQRQIAGTWWGYSGSTERRIGLCANGTYQDYSESGYSGQSHDSLGSETMAWGAASQGGGQGSWSISGSTESGTISIRYSDGSTANMKYQQINDPGCLSFDGNTLCRKSAKCN